MTREQYTWAWRFNSAQWSRVQASQETIRNQVHDQLYIYTVMQLQKYDPELSLQAIMVNIGNSATAAIPNWTRQDFFTRTKFLDNKNTRSRILASRVGKTWAQIKAYYTIITSISQQLAWSQYQEHNVTKKNKPKHLIATKIVNSQNQSQTLRHGGIETCPGGHHLQQPYQTSGTNITNYKHLKHRHITI